MKILYSSKEREFAAMPVENQRENLTEVDDSMMEGLIAGIMAGIGGPYPCCPKTLMEGIAQRAARQKRLKKRDAGCAVLQRRQG